MAKMLSAGRLAQLKMNHDDSMGEVLELREDEFADLVYMGQEMLRANDELRRLCGVEKAAAEVWASVPASYDPHDPMVIRHAKALNALGTTLRTAR